MRRWRGFTLIELLVVIAIVAILAALLFPVFTHARERARQTACNSNLRQLAQAMRLYLDDSNGRYPEAWNTYTCEPWSHAPGSPSPMYGHQPHDAAIRVVLDPYVSTSELWRCPSDVGDNTMNNAGGYQHRTPPFYPWVGSSYHWGDVGFRLQNIRYLAGRSERSVREPVGTGLFWDARPWHYWSERSVHISKRTSFVNIVFCDGHVKPMQDAEWAATVY